MAQACPGKKVALRPSQTAAAEAAAVSGDVSYGEWKDVVKKGRKSLSLPPEQEVP